MKKFLLLISALSICSCLLTGNILYAQQQPGKDEMSSDEYSIELLDFTGGDERSMGSTNYEMRNVEEQEIVEDPEVINRIWQRDQEKDVEPTPEEPPAEEPQVEKPAAEEAPPESVVKIQEPAPKIKVWFGNRLYNPAIYGPGKQPFIVSEKGTIKIEVDIPNPYQLKESASHAMSVKNPKGEVQTFNIQNVSGFKASAIGASPLVIESAYDLKAEDQEATYTYTFNASSKGNVGIAAQSAAKIVVTIMGGAAKLIGTPITYPSPLYLKTAKEVTFQYNLSRDTNIVFTLIDVSGRVVKRSNFNAGEEGGSAGTNKPTWNLITESGGQMYAGIFLYTIVNRDDKTLLAKGKLVTLP
ncbi:MAG: hypothetical protein ABIA67_03995 [Candidatus Margulisiibacteriota bacterium]